MAYNIEVNWRDAGGVCGINEKWMLYRRIIFCSRFLERRHVYEGLPIYIITRWSILFNWRKNNHAVKVCNIFLYGYPYPWRHWKARAVAHSFPVIMGGLCVGGGQETNTGYPIEVTRPYVGGWWMEGPRAGGEGNHAPTQRRKQSLWQVKINNYERNFN